jgi:hypothetical protein
MELLKAKDVRLTRKDEQVIAVLGFDLNGDCRGNGATVSDALRSLASEIERRGTSVWVPVAAKQYREDGILKAACPECGAVHEMSGFAEVIAFVCDECGAGIDVDPEIG